jgi:ATP-dependent Clp endopeptidase proteolytic subunit ClpP
MIGHIYISGLIGSFLDEKGIELIDVISATQKFKDADQLFVYIDSPGGSIQVGDNIYEFLKSLPQKVTTVGVGMVASIATKISFAGDERIMIVGPGSEYMIHNPWVSNVSGDADELIIAAEDIRNEEDKLISFYSENTGISREGIAALMKAETFLTPERALELGFITKIMTMEEAQQNGMILPNKKLNKVKALAFKEKQKEKMSKEILSKLDQTIEMLGKFIGIKKEEKPEKKALILQDSNGTQLEITNADGSDITGNPAKGNMVTVDGKPADGSFILADYGVTITVSAGTITDVVETKNVEDEPEMEALKKSKATLQEENKNLKAELEEMKTTNKEIADKFSLVEKALKTIQSNYNPGGKENHFRKVGDDTNEKKNIASEAKERRKNYKS